MKLIERYVIREVLLPFVLGLLVFTFMLIIPFIIEQAETLIAKNVSTGVILQVMATLLPATMSLTIPMALLLGLLVAFGRLSADREFVAMQACGVSLTRLMRPVAVLSIACWAATSFMIIKGMPDANQAFRDITYRIVADRAEGEVRERVFFTEFPDVVLYVRDIPATGGWNDIFLADSRPGKPQTAYLAKRGRVLLDREARTIEMVLQDGTSHTADPSGKYETARFEQLILNVNAESVFPRDGLPRGAHEMTITDLQTRAAELEGMNVFPHTEYFEIQKKFSIPFACFVFGLIGLGLGATNRRDGKMASFVIGIGVILIYWALLYGGQSLIRGHVIPPWLGAWSPNILLGGAGLALLRWRNRAADRPLRLPLPRWPWLGATADATTAPVRRPLALGLAMVSRLIPMPSILDRYVWATFTRIFLLSAVGLAALFYLAAFLDNVERVFRGTATWTMLGGYLWHATPQNVYYVLPLSVLLGALVTIGALTKNSELIVMKACGISLYRVALPMVVGACLVGGVLFGLEETVLGSSNRQAEALRHVMRGGDPALFNVLNRRWMVGAEGQIYNYDYFDPREGRLQGLSIYEFDDSMQRLERRTFAQRATFLSGDAEEGRWRVEGGWTREFTETGETKVFEPFTERQAAIEPATFFGTEPPEPQFMSYTQLRRYMVALQASGFDVVEQQVGLARKVAFPFVTLVMTMIAIPFAVTTGSRGAMYGVGIGILLAITYWVTISVFAAIGTAGLVTPVLAAWAPNLLFAAGAGYLLLTVRT